ncbi:TBC1 domain family member protein [Quillaja saponaria]|uniref:TBC1 domain family member protein n=1 Tax=Quillaja saponaria TaxID=32244 RepID=A0AAD7PYS7_QUISA|nr:TBC1 domain family member protein [Quillaja saponaria]
MKAATAINPLITMEHKRDAYGFAVRPQHLQRYREYSTIYKEEEEERSDRWKSFLERQEESAQLDVNGLSLEEDDKVLQAEASEKETDANAEKGVDGHESSGWKPGSDKMAENGSREEDIPASKSGSLEDEQNNQGGSLKVEQKTRNGESFLHIHEAKLTKGTYEEDSEDEFYDVERSDPVPDVPSANNMSTSANSTATNLAPPEFLFPWREELEVLVRGGVPMALRGELWQTFVGVKARRVDKYYQALLTSESNSGNNMDQLNTQSSDNNGGTNTDSVYIPEKWKGQIEKDLPRTFPGHPALDEDGRNALRRLLTAYARHNPSVGYCQAMNFFAGLLLLLMPEENAFWTLMGIIDDYFDGYYSEEMLESQVDQLVFEELVRERFPKLGGMAWVTGPWFLSIFMNMLPWESVLRVWDVLLFEGNRVMLFRTALALMELYGPALVTTKDAGDAVTLLQSLAGSTFDSSQLVLTACMGFQNVNEIRLQELRIKHRPSVIAAVEERSKGLRALRDSQGLASKLYGFKHDPNSMMKETNKAGQLDDAQINNVFNVEPGSTIADEVLIGLTGDAERDSVSDLQEQVVCLKVELCRLLEEKRSFVLRAEELETALMEMVKQDNRLQLSARVEQLEQEVSDLRRALSDKQEQENVMLQVLMRVEQEQKVTEDARRFAEQDAAAQRYAAQVLQEKYEEATASLAEMEKKVIMAESMLEATLQYQSGQVKAQPSPRSPHPDSSIIQINQDPIQDIPTRRIGLLSRPFGLGWRDRNKGKPTTGEEPSDGKSTNGETQQATR